MEKRAKKALVLEGGGIRSSYLSGVLLALEQGGVTDFDLVCGTSAGSCCGANFITGQAEKSVIILRDYLTGKRFVRLNKIFSSHNILDIDYLVEEVCRFVVPLDVPKIKNNKIKLLMTATDIQTGKPYYFNNWDHDIFTALKASCALPYLYRNVVFHEGHRYIDGGMTDSIPIMKAIAEGAKEILVVSTRERGYRKSQDKIPNWLHKAFWPRHTIVPSLFRERHKHYNEAMDLIENPTSDLKIDLIAPTHPLPVTRMTRDKAKVTLSIEQGMEDGRKFLELSS